MSAARPHSLAYPRFNRFRDPRIIQKCDVLFPGNADHHPEPMALSCIKQPQGRNGVSANGIYAVSGHAREIGADNLQPCSLRSNVKFPA